MSKRAKDHTESTEVSPGNSEADGAKSGDDAPIAELADSARGATPSQPSLEGQLEAMKAQLAEKQAEIAELKDKYLRALADQENTRKRLRQQAEENSRMQREALLRDLLPIVDDLERAVVAARGGGNGKSIVEGVEMVLRSVQEFLRGYGVTSKESVGKRFDPKFHEAVDRIESEEHPPNTVIAEFARGYQIEDRTLRPARVTVATAAKAAPDKENPDGGKTGQESGGNVENH